MPPPPCCACWPNASPGRRTKTRLLAVRGPERTLIEIDARRHVPDAPGRDVVHDDEAVIGAKADERDLAAVWRPLRSGLLAPRLDERLFSAIHIARRPHRRDLCAMNLPVSHEQHGAPIRRELRRRCIVYDPPRGAAGSACGPYGSFGTFRIGGRIGGPADPVRRRPTEKNDRAAVVRDLDAGEIDAVVLEEVGEASRRECRRGGGVGVAHPFLERRPRYAIGFPRGDDFERRRGAQELLVGRYGLRCGRDCPRTGYPEGNRCERQDETGNRNGTSSFLLGQQSYRRKVAHIIEARRLVRPTARRVPARASRRNRRGRAPPPVRA